MKFAKIIDGFVDNIVECNQAFVDSQPAYLWIQLPDSTLVSNGWKHLGDNNFEALMLDPIPTHKTVMSLVEFLVLVGKNDNKKIKAKRNTSDDVDFFWDIIHASREIDVQSPVIVDGMNMLVVEVAAFTQAKADEILLGVPL